MNPYMAQWTAQLDGAGIHYSVRDEKSLSLGFSSKGETPVQMVLAFDEVGEMLMLSWKSVTFPEGQEVRMLERINEANGRTRWVKFLLDDDKDISAYGCSRAEGVSAVELICKWVNQLRLGYDCILATRCIF